VLCADEPVKSPVDLTLVPEHRRENGALHGALNRGRIDTERLRTLLAGLPLPQFEDGRLVLAVDVSPWLRSDAPCSADRLFCHVYGRAKSASQFIPGWPYSFVAALEPGVTSWTSIPDVLQLGPEDDATAVTAAQLRAVVERSLRPANGSPRTRTSRSSWTLATSHPPGLGPAGSSGRTGRADPLGPSDALAGALARGVPPRPPPRRASAQARAGVPLRQIQDLAQSSGHHGHRHRELWQGRGPGMGPGAPEADPPLAWLEHDGELPVVEGTQLRLARRLAADLCRPWEKPTALYAL